MATYISFSNDVKGPCNKKGHEGWIELEDWSWGCEREESGGNQIGLASGIPKFDVLNFNATIGSATIAMYQKMLNGTHFDKVVIEATKNIGQAEPATWLKLELEHVLVRKIAQSISADEASDSIDLAFSQLHMEISDQKADGSLEAAKEFQYDLTTAVG